MFDIIFFRVKNRELHLNEMGNPLRCCLSMCDLEIFRPTLESALCRGSSK